MVLLISNAQARTVEIKMSTCPKPYVENIRKITASLGSADELILNFDKAGKYEFDGSLKFRCNTTIKGVSPQATKVIVNEGFVNGKSKMQESSFFAIHGTSHKKVKATIKDIGFELASHKGILWENSPKHIIKIVDADGVVVDNVVSKTKNAVLTNLDLRECANVIVQNSEFENYNNCDDGGCLWSRGNQNNIVIRNNVFQKYGKDEVLGCWGGSHDNDFDLKNVVVENNEFYLVNKTGSKPMEISNFITFSHAYGEGAKTYCTIDSVLFNNNKIILDAPIKRILKLDLSKYAIVRNIEISNNEILNTSKSSSENLFMNDIDISAESFENTNICIKNNIIRSHNKVLGDGHTFLSLKNASVTLSNNIVESDYPYTMLWCHGGTLNLNLTGNRFSELKMLARMNSSKGMNKVQITAINNEFTGATGLNCLNIKDMTLNFKKNIFNCSDSNLFLTEAAQRTSITFEENIVNANKGKGRIYINHSGNKYNFSYVNISNNTFSGVSKNDITAPFKNVRDLQVKGNNYR